MASLTLRRVGGSVVATFPKALLLSLTPKSPGPRSAFGFN